ncbi:MAG: hypothetical protein R6X02_25440 [Enhygromyxa sp.]
MIPPKYFSIWSGLALTFGLAAPLSITACTSDEIDADEEAADEAGTEAEGEGEGEGNGDGDGDLTYVPARGIHILEVEANQGTAVLIGKDGEWVGAEGRNAYMIRDRDTLVRLQHTVDDNWIPRDIRGVLHIRDAEGNELPPRIRDVFVEGPSDPKNLNTNFYFSVLADEAQPGASYWVELLELEGQVDVSGLSEGVSVTPSGYQMIGYELTPLEMKVMLVPIEYTYIDPPTIVEPTEADIQLVHDDLLQTNPLQTVDIEVHEPYTYTQHITNLGQLLSPMRSLRGNEGAAPNVYYHAIVDVRGPSVNMVAGIASLTGDSQSEGINRVAATVWFKQAEDIPPGGSSGTLVHEIGHNQGLSHVYCPQAASEAAGPDPNYPHEGGKIGVYGFGIRNFRLYTPTAAHDYMTYCGNAWVSDWTWNKTYKRINTLTSWDYEGAAPGTGSDARVPLLVGTLFPDGSEDWWVMMGPAPDPDLLGSQQRISIVSSGGIIDEIYSHVSMLSDDATQVVIAPLKMPISELEGITRVDWRGQSHPVGLESIQIDHAVAVDYR